MRFQGSNLTNLSDKLRIQSSKVRIKNTSDKQGSMTTEAMPMSMQPRNEKVGEERIRARHKQAASRTGSTRGNELGCRMREEQ
jgi:hypothetical protein